MKIQPISDSNLVFKSQSISLSSQKIPDKTVTTCVRPLSFKNKEEIKNYLNCIHDKYKNSQIKPIEKSVVSVLGKLMILRA